MIVPKNPALSLTMRKYNVDGRINGNKKTTGNPKI